jgi:hypothetical protein
MANEINNALKSAAEKIAKYVDNVATMTVETRYVDVDDDKKTIAFDQAKPAARTEIRLDGDCSAVVPVRHNEAGLTVVDTDLFEMHERNVQTAIEYRARMMDALLNTFKQIVS